VVITVGASAVPARLELLRSEDSLDRRGRDRVDDMFLEAHAMRGKTGARELYDFENELHQRLMEVEREVVGEVTAASDVDADAIEIEGVGHRRVLNSAETYLTAFRRGPG
jgi:hypothetical protein